jgi:phytol kinase
LLASVLPDLRTTLTVAPLALVEAAVAGWIVAYLRSGGMRVAYTRKIFHFAIFSAAAVVHGTWGLPGTMVFGTVVASVVLFAVWRGDDFPLYEAMARDSDRPHRSLFILVPLATTAIGGLAAALLAGPYAAVGYLAAGWGDAVGEPVGARWGRHKYRVPSIAGVAATRSWEGSAGVFLVASLGSTVALTSIGGAPAWGGILCGAVAALVEGISNHGLDNLTVQLVPSLVAAAVFGPGIGLGVIALL